MNGEYGIAIIWNYFDSKNIINELKKKFVIKKIIDVNWKEKNIVERHKIINDIYEIDIPNDDWRVLMKPTKITNEANMDIIKIIILFDKKFNYEQRKTRGIGEIKYLNVNFFDRKEKIRNIYGKHSIHMTDNCNDFNSTLKCLDIKGFYTQYRILPIKELNCVIWANKFFGQDQDNNPIYYKLEETCHYKYLLNNKKEYIDYCKYDKKHNPKNFDKLIKKFDYKNYFNSKRTKGRNLIKVDTDSYGKYFVRDGLHRLSILCYRLKLKEILVHFVDTKFDLEKKRVSRKKSHAEQFYLFLQEINRSSIDYIFLRGFLKLPICLDTDLDIITKDIEKITKIASSFLDKVTDNDSINRYQYKTVGDTDPRIPNGFFLIDISKNIEFPKILNYTISDDTTKDIFKKKEKKIIFNNYFYYIPSNEYEYILLKLRVHDKPKRKPKHEERLSFLLNKIDKDKYIKLPVIENNEVKILI
jgi:hypothetical protein